MPPIDAESMQKIVWLVLLLLFAGAEAATVGLTSIWFAAGALFALIAALLGGSLWIQVTLFLAVVCSETQFKFLRPGAKQLS